MNLGVTAVKLRKVDEGIFDDFRGHRMTILIETYFDDDKAPVRRGLAMAAKPCSGAAHQVLHFATAQRGRR